ncbi:adenylate kinase 7-like [Stigmatopora nigra]
MGDRKRTRRIFVNDVDKYSSKHIAEYLSTCGERVEEEDEGEMLSEEPAFQLVGTVSSASSDKISFLHEQYTSLNREELLPRLLECDIVVYNISENAKADEIDEATWAITALHGEMENFKSKKTFILVSTVMTWAMTKPPESQEEAETLITEEEFRKRRPHPSFKNHNNMEKQVLKLGTGKKNKLKGYVLAAGIQYGKGENLFHYFFKVSWLSECSKVPIFGEGTNFIPTIHVLDLAKVIQNLIEVKPKSKYILAIDESKSKLEDIVKAISHVLGPGKVCQLPANEAIGLKAFKLEELEYLSIDLRLDAFVVKDSFNFTWSAENGMIENIESLVEEYRQTRKLLPIRICLTGPPAVGKSKVAEQLCEHYRIHHINIREVIKEKMAQLKDTMTRSDIEVNEQETAQNQLQTIQESMEGNADRLEDDLLLELLTEKLNSKPCRNQGFVFYGFPKTFEQARQMFSADDADNLDWPDGTPSYNKITPEYVFALDASDEFLTKKVQDLPQIEAQKRGLTQDEFVPRLVRFRQLSRAAETSLDYFDELEIYPAYLEVKDDDPELTQIVSNIIEVVGGPKNYGLSPEEQEEEDRRREMERKQKLAEEAAEEKRRKEASLAEMAAQYEAWQNNLAEVKRQEHELLEAKALPLRNYLMKYVMPALTEALQECSKIKPNDPVSFLAEYLLRMDKVD